MRRFVVCLVAGLVVAGCGDSNEIQFTRASVEDSMTELTRTRLKAGATMDPLECVMDGDETHWRCIAAVRQDGRVYTFITQITCDVENGECLSEPQSLDPR